MKVAIILIVVGITLIVSSIIEWNKNIKRIKELEERLDEYYKRRENRILKGFRNIDNIQ
jgi:uncharacterized membrane protein YidH (DUF202 family)